VSAPAPPGASGGGSLPCLRARAAWHGLLDSPEGPERHARQRHRLARFRRRSIVVSKAVRMVEASIALFARFGGDAGVGELLSMLT
jgi:hypothetical protein